MRGRWFLRSLKFVLCAVLFVALAGFVVMRLWNWLTPTLFGWHLITFWQAVGILILSKILIGGFRGHGCGKSCGPRGMMARWEHMTPEEREKFREGMRGRCGSYGRASAETKA
ncbi:MAG TPA: hypothetical protein VLL05_15740 [Terriglobales bacterium]|nr:hypothetical protein [Terriglobales bacterium]